LPSIEEDERARERRSERIKEMDKKIKVRKRKNNKIR
jgi:hypothetical protein